MNNENLPEKGTELLPEQKNDNALNLAEDFAEIGTDIKDGVGSVVATWKIASYDSIFALIYWVLGYIYFANLSHIIGEGIMALIFSVLYVATVLFYLKLKKITPPRESYLWLCVLLLCAISKAIFENKELNTLSMLLLHGAAVYWTMSATNALLRFKTSAFLPRDAIRGVIVLPFIRFFAWFMSLVAVPRLHSGSIKRKNTLSAFLGVALGGAAICIALPLLAQADSGFEGLVGNFLYNFSQTDFLLNAFFSLPIAAYLFSLLFASVNCNAPREKAEQAAEKAKKLPIVTAVTVLGMLSALYFLFLAVILWQLIPAFSGILPNGIIYSEYARTGFFELCKVCSFTLIVMSIIFGCVIKNWRESRALKAMVLLISVSSLGLCITALGRMLLYIASYGLSTLRLTTSLFILFLTLVFVLLAINVFKPFNIVKAAFCTLCIGTTLMLCANTSNIIASYNLTRYENASLIDAEFTSLFNFTVDNMPALKAYRDRQKPNSAEHKEAQRCIGVMHSRLNNKIKASPLQLTLAEYFVLAG